MLETHCTNTECTELDVVKEVPEVLADASIMCGACGEPTTSPATTTRAKGERVA